MSKHIVLVTLALGIACVLHVSEAGRAGQGFCYEKINRRTGGCKRKMSGKFQKVDCCSQGGAGWSKRRGNKASCEPCRTSVTETSYWGDWGEWSECNATCGPSFKVSKRECISKGEKTCRGIGEKRKTCKTLPCPVDGGWSLWGNWSRCSKTCGTGHQIRTRTCSNPIPQYGGKDCQGPMEQNRSCEEAKHCPIHGGWGEWGEWSRCSKTCDLGKQTRVRECDSPRPQYGGTPCLDAERVDGKYCREKRCDDESGHPFSGLGPGSGSASGSGSGSGSSGSGSGEWEVLSGAWKDDEDY